MTTLYYRDNVSDKIYTADLSDAGNGLFDVVIAYGRRGSTLTTSNKNTKGPLTKDAAQKTLEKVLREKMSKGYTEGADAPAYTATDKEDRFTSILPMLLNPIEESELEYYITHEGFCAEEKFDGKHMILRKNADGSVDAINRKGLLIGAPEAILQEARSLPGEFIIDGECVGEIFYAFDYISAFVWSERNRRLWKLMLKGPQVHIVGVESMTYTRTKRRLLEDLLARNAEGIVFKRMNNRYTAGRPNKGGNALKFKFYATASVVVGRINDKRSVGIFVWREDGVCPVLTPCGNVTIPPNKDIPEVGRSWRFAISTPSRTAVFCSSRCTWALEMTSTVMPVPMTSSNSRPAKRKTNRFTPQWM